MNVVVFIVAGFWIIAHVEWDALKESAAKRAKRPEGSPDESVDAAQTAERIDTNFSLAHGCLSEILEIAGTAVRLLLAAVRAFLALVRALARFAEHFSW